MPLLISYVFHGWGEGRYIYLTCICRCSVTKSFPTLHNPMDCSMQRFPVLHHLPEFAQVHGHWIGDAIQPSHPLSSSAPSAINLSQHHGLFQWVSSSHQVTKVMELQLQHHSCHHQHSELVSFRTDWFDLLAFQGTLKSLLQHYSLKALILWHSAFFVVQFSHWYMTTGKTIALTIGTFVGIVLSLLFNILTRFVMAFLPRSNHLLIS